MRHPPVPVGRIGRASDLDSSHKFVGWFEMKTALGLTMLGAVVAGVCGIMAVGWAYEGPRRFFRRVRLRRAMR